MATEQPVKKEIVELVEKWLVRSQPKPFQVALRLAMSRDVFHHHYVNRQRRVNHNQDDTVKLIKIFCQGLDAEHRCTAKEAIDFAILSQLPLNRFVELEQLFPADEWQAAWSEYLPIPNVTEHPNTTLAILDALRRIQHPQHQGDQPVLLPV